MTEAPVVRPSAGGRARLHGKRARTAGVLA